MIRHRLRAVMGQKIRAWRKEKPLRWKSSRPGSNKNGMKEAGLVGRESLETFPTDGYT